MCGSTPFEAPAGAQYVKLITAAPSDRRARSAFQDLVLAKAPRGALLFDFGAGPGIDARFFAERGFAVEAYDHDPRMCDFFAAHCRDLIDSSQVILDRCTYREFVDRETLLCGRPADIIVSNFAVLNQVEELSELFATFHRLTAPTGRVLISVLNPWFIGDMRYRWWWRSAPRMLRHGHVFVPARAAPAHTRRQLAEFIAVSSPYFALTSVFRSSPGRGRPTSGIEVRHGSAFVWLHLATSRFMFLLFERLP
jgi:SAM-dependent methyltransferase